MPESVVWVGDSTVLSGYQSVSQWKHFLWMLYGMTASSVCVALCTVHEQEPHFVAAGIPTWISTSADDMYYQPQWSLQLHGVTSVRCCYIIIQPTKHVFCWPWASRDRGVIPALNFTFCSSFGQAWLFIQEAIIILIDPAEGLWHWPTLLTLRAESDFGTTLTVTVTEKGDLWRNIFKSVRKYSYCHRVNISELTGS